VRIYDPAIGQSTYGKTISECLPNTGKGRQAIVAISQRSAFIRPLYVPNTSRDEIRKILELQLGRLLPIPASDTVFDFRLGPESPGKGRLAIVGAIKADSLRKIFEEAKSNDFGLRAVLPLAFGSWLAGRSRSLESCAVAEVQGGFLNIDILQKGELWYSRSIPAPESAGDIEDEIARTFSIAEVPGAPVLAAASPQIEGDLAEPRQTIEFLADPHAIDKFLFTFQLPEKLEAARARQKRWVAQRALAAAIAAVAFGGYSYISHLNGQVQSASNDAGLQSSLQEAKIRQKNALTKLAEAKKANRILNVAFRPGQSFSDMITALANSASAKSWFTSVSITRGQPITLTGLSTSDGDIANYITDLAKDPRFQEMKLISANRANIGKKQVTQFLITGRAIGSLAFDHPPKAEKKT